MKAAGAPQEPCETESEIETADRPKQWNGIRAAQTGTPRNDTRLDRLLQAGRYEIRPGANRPMAAQTDTYVYLEELEEATYTGKESPKVWNQAILCAYVG